MAAPLAPADRQARIDAIAAGTTDGLTVAQIAARLDIGVQVLRTWSARHRIELPRSKRTRKGWPHCTNCRRKPIALGDKNRPAKHGLCLACRQRPSGIDQHAFAYSRWTAYGTYGPTLAAELEHFAWCCVCSAGGQADDRAQAERWVREHNAAKHAMEARGAA